MAWQTPKTDWTGVDGVRNTDMNRIEGNTLELYNETLRSSISVYVSTSGNDSTGAGTSASPYRTIEKALSVIPTHLNGRSASISLAAGNYDEYITLRGFTGPITITGAGTARLASLTVVGCVVNITSVTLTVTSGITVRDGGVLTTTGDINVTSGVGLSVSNGGSVVITGTLNISGTSTGINASSGTVYAGTISGTGVNSGIVASNGAVVSYGARTYVAVVPTTTVNGGRINTGAQTTGSGGQVLSTLSAGDTEVTVTNDLICDTCMIDVYTDHFGVSPINEVVDGNTLTLTFVAQQEDVNVKVVID